MKKTICLIAVLSLTFSNGACQNNIEMEKIIDKFVLNSHNNVSFQNGIHALIDKPKNDTDALEKGFVFFLYPEQWNILLAKNVRIDNKDYRAVLFSYDANKHKHIALYCKEKDDKYFFRVFDQDEKKYEMWNKLNNTTWSKADSFAGQHYIFYEDLKGNKRCIHQILGSGVYVVSSEIVDISFLEHYKLIDNKLISENDTLKLYSDEPLISSAFGHLDIEKVKKDISVIDGIVSFITTIDINNATKDGIYLNGYVVNIEYTEIKNLNGKKVKITGKVTNSYGIEEPNKNQIIKQGRNVIKKILNPEIEILN